MYISMAKAFGAMAPVFGALVSAYNHRIGNMSKSVVVLIVLIRRVLGGFSKTATGLWQTAPTFNIRR